MENEPDYLAQSRDFADRFNKAVELMVARKMKVSIPTVGRWMRGKSSPHPLMQESIFKALEDNE